MITWGLSAAYQVVSLVMVPEWSSAHDVPVKQQMMSAPMASAIRFQLIRLSFMTSPSLSSCELALSHSQF